MLMRFKNRTDYIQQINLIDGSGVKVGPRSPKGGFVDLDITQMYKEELKRAQKFFEISPAPVEQKEQKEEKDFSRKIKKFKRR